MNNNEQQSVFDEWMTAHKGLLFKFVRAYAHTAEDRDDLFQEIALQVWRSVPQFRGESAVTTWLYRISINTSIAWNRKEKKHNVGKESLNGIDQLLKESKVTDPRLDWLYEQIAGMNPVDRTLTLLLLDGYSYKEMAGMVGVSESNIGVKIHRIKNQLISKSEKIVNHGI